MGDAKRRKALGLYPAETAVKPMRAATAPVEKKLECNKCGRTGGTFGYTPEGYVHVPSCEFAQAVQMRKAARRKAEREKWLAHVDKHVPAGPAREKWHKYLKEDPE